MKIISKKYIIFFCSLTVVFLFAYSFMWFPTGYIGTTKKGGEGLGCVCHGIHENTPAVSVNIVGPDSVATGQTVTFQVKLSHGPAITGGFNLASYLDTTTLYPVIGDTMVRKEEGELTHLHPRFFENDTAIWIVRYIARNTPGIDTLYATGNSTNNNLEPDTLDQWNWSANKVVVIYEPIGIINISSIAKEFSISQNFPNPFNPVTRINFSIAKSSDIRIKIFDILGNVTAEPVHQKMNTGEYSVDFNASNLASGVYFYSLISDGITISTKKMLLVK